MAFQLNIPDEFKDIAAICTATDVQIGGCTVLGIADARALHAGLKVGRSYNAWLSNRLETLGFVEGEDFEKLDCPVLDNQVGHGGDRKSKICRLTLEAAKHIAMVEKNEIGQKVRRYFLWCEKAAHEAPSCDAIPANEAVSLKIVTEGRQTFGTKAAQQLWFMRGLPVVPAMREAIEQQRDIFGENTGDLVLRVPASMVRQ